MYVESKLLQANTKLYTYDVPQTGRYTVNVLFAGDHVANSPYQVGLFATVAFLNVTNVRSCVLACYR